MKAKLNFRSKRTIIIASLIAALAVGAGVGGYFYARGNNQAGATNVAQEGTQQIEVEQPNPSTPDNGNNNPGANVNPANNDNNNGNAADGTDATNGNNNNGNAGNNNAGVNNGNPDNNNAGANGGNANNGVANNGGANNAGNAGNPANAGDGNDATTTTVTVTELNPWESHSVNWLPQTLNVSTPEVTVNKNNIEVTKKAVTSTGAEAVSEGDKITYTITVKNNNSEKLNSLYITDEIPEGTKFVSVENGGETVKENDVVTKVVWNLWNLGIEPGAEYSVSFTVEVSKKSGTIKNAVLTEGSNSNEVKNPIVITEKTANLVEKVKDEDGKETEKVTKLSDEDTVKVGQIIRYTITATNTSKEVKTSIKISDNVPEGTTLVGEKDKEVTLKIGNKTTEYAISKLNEGIEVDLDKEETATITFDVKVNDTTTTKILNNAKVNEHEEKTENKVANIKTIKKSEKEVETLHENDTITYTLTSTNSGDGKGSVVIKDEVPVGTTIQGEKDKEVTLSKDSKVEKEYAIKDLKEGITVELEPGETKVITFTVKIDSFKEGDANVKTTTNEDGTKSSIRTITNAVATLDGEKIPETNDEVEKEYVHISGTKTWIVPEGIKYPEVTINLFRNGGNDPYKTTTIKDGAEEYSFKNLDKYDAEGNEYRYSVTESEVKGYKSEQDGNNFKNTIKDPEDVKVEGKKSWTVGEDLEKYPEVTINLFQNGGEKPYKTTTIKDGGTSYKFENLPKYKVDEDGNYELKDGKVQLNEYTVEEVKIDGYESVQSGNDFKNTVIDPENVKIEGTKTWITGADITEYPTITINLFQNGGNKPYKTTTIENGGTSYKFENLPKYKVDEQGNYVLNEDGKVQLNKYTVREVTPDDYGVKQDGNNFTNTIIDPADIDIEGTKTWVLPEGTEYPEVTINLFQNEGTEPYRTKTIKATDVNENGVASYKFKGLAKYKVDKDGKFVKNSEGKVELNTYRVEEVEVEGYSVEQDGNNFTNTIKDPSNIKIEGTKTWVIPDEAKENIEYPEVTINLFKNGENTPYKTTTIKNGGTSYKFENLPKYITDEQGNYILKDGKVQENKYTVTESVAEGYTTSQNGNNFTNTLQTTSVKVEKVWEDAGNQNLTHPTITVNLLRNGNVYRTQNLRNGTEEYTFNNLPVKDANGRDYSYTISENDVPGYTKSNPEATDTGFKITNTLQTTSVKVEKDWDDRGNANLTHPTITINLLQNGIAYKTQNLKNGTLEYTFENLPVKDANGRDYSYTISENDVPGYTKSNPEATNAGFKIKNTLQTTNVKVEKDWNDKGNANLTHPTIIINLLQNGNQYKSQRLENGTLEYTFENLPVKDATGKDYTYTISENDVPGYAKSEPEETKTGYKITNTLTSTSVEVEKEWDDKGNKIDHPEITINLYQNGGEKAYKTAKITTPNTKYKFDNLPTVDAEGKPYTYTVSEEDVTGYLESDPVATETGYKIKNTLDVTSKTVKKNWDDKGNTIIHPEITVNLYQNDSKTAFRTGKIANTADSFTFENLPKVDENGDEYVYTAKEEAVTGYITTASTDTFTITNTLDVTSKTVTKEWDDKGNTVTHPEITVNLYQNDSEEVFQTKTIPNTETSCTFTNLPKVDANGKEYVYTAQEATVPGYTASYSEDKLTIKNTLDAKNIVVKKNWDDKGVTVTHPEITVKLYQNGNETPFRAGTIKNTEDSYTFRDLPKTDASGKDYVYTVSEDTVIGYEKSEPVATANGYEITNTLKTFSINVEKQWDRDGRTDVNIPEKIAIELSDGTKTENKELLKSNDWKDTYVVPKYDDEGNVLAYTVTENNVQNFVLTATETNTNGDNITITLKNTLPKLVIEKEVVSISKDGSTTNTEGADGDNIKVTPGTVVKYRLKVTNGKVELNNVKIVDSMTNGKKIYRDYNAETDTLSNEITNGEVTTISKLAANAVKEDIYVYYRVEKADTINKNNSDKITNSATATGKYTDNKGDEKTVTDSDDAYVTVQDDFTLEVEKHQAIGNKNLDDKETSTKVEPGTEITYTITVTNNGNVDQTNLVVTDVMTLNGETRANLKVKNMTIDSAHQLENGKIVSLPIGDTATITATYEVQEEDMSATENNTIKNKVTVNDYSDEVTITTEKYKSNIKVRKEGILNGKTKITNAEKPMKVEYGDEITYNIIISNEGNKKGNVTVWDTILKDMSDAVELVGNIKLVDKDGNKVKDVTRAELESEAGYAIKDVDIGNDVLSIEFTVKVKAYAGTVISNTAKFKTENDDEPKDTNTVTVEAEDEADIVSTVSTTVTQTVPQKAILVLDFSGSMDDSINRVKKITSLKSAVNTFLTKFLNGKNEVMIITYSGNASVACEYTKNKDTAYNSIKNKGASGGTNIDGGLTLANSKITSNASNTSVILMTDGLPCYYIDNEDGSRKEEGDGNYYTETPANEAIESAGWIKNKGSKVYSIGFGLDSIGKEKQVQYGYYGLEIVEVDVDPTSRAKAKELMQKIASPTTYNDDGTIKNKYCYDTFDGDALEQAFKDIVDTISTTADTEAVPVETDDGIITISEGFKAGQKVEIYKNNYNKDNLPEPWKSYTWTQFLALSYTTYKDGVIKFDLGNFMKETSDVKANDNLTFRFVD